jgi:hypothetical protein
MTPGPASAQAVPYRPPSVSPYINLGQPFNDPGITYYGIVRPELATRSAIQGLQQQQLALGREVAAEEQNAPLPPTGHPIGFFTQAHYFFNLGPQRTGAQRPAAATAPPQRPSRR